MHKLLMLVKNRNTQFYLHYLEAARLPDLDIVSAPAHDVDLIFGDPDLIREVLTDLPSLKWVQSTWAGVEPLLDPSLRHDYILTNARGVFGGLMSEYVFGYLLLHERKILQRMAAQQDSRWDPSLNGTLRGKTIGLLGVGSIGAHLAESAKHFGMQVLGYTRSSENSLFVDKYYHGDNLSLFASQLDVLVSVLPHTPHTNKIIDANLLKCLPKRALLINVGRGSALDEKALLNALNQGKLAGAVLDVFEQEPLPPDHPFWQTKNIFITSHTSAPSCPKDITSLFIENYRAYIQGSPLKYRVDFELGY